MKQCESSFFTDFQATYIAINGSSKFDVVSGCGTAGSGKIGIYQDRSNRNLAYGEGGQFSWSVPPTLRIISSRFTARLRDANGIKAELLGFEDGTFTDLDGGVPHDGTQQFPTWSNAGKPQSRILARLTCDRQAGCENLPSSVRSFFEVSNAEFTVHDGAAPSVAASGELWQWGADPNYHRGEASIRIEAADGGSGVAALWLDVNGLRVNLPDPVCPGAKGSYATRFGPCPSEYTATKSIDTSAAPFQQGANLLRVCARDYAVTEAQSTKTCSPPRVVQVDSEPSNPPVDLRADQGSGWQPENGFSLRWEIPGGQKAPIVGAIYTLRRLDSDHQINAGYFPGNGPTEAGPIEVPEAGAFRASIALVDNALNLGHPAEVILRFDDRPPGDVEPTPAAGWISRDEMPIEQEVERAEAGGPSGVSGYALAVSHDSSSRPCGTGICLAPELTLSGGADQRTGSLGPLTEGDHWISAVAVSGARRSSLEAGSTMVKVDRTPPVAAISGVPGEWVNRPVTVSVTASDALSGMQSQPDDDGEPRTVIHAENYAPYSAPGPAASFVVATEGVNRIRYWAEDLAGNANDGMAGPGGEAHASPGQAVVRIDTTPPEIGFLATRDSEDPELVLLNAEDADSGVSSARISIRRAGSAGAWQALETVRVGGRFEARVPSDDLAQGAYELRAQAQDRAGNEATGSQTLDGEPMILNLPLKEPTALTVSLARGKRSLRAPYEARPLVEGRLTSDGAALRNQPVRIVETRAGGSHEETSATVVTTDGDGRFRNRLAKGPSRRVEVFFEGDRKLSRASGSPLRIKVRGRVRLKIRPRRVYNGGLVRMRGSVGMRGALRPARGKLVAIQYLDPGRGKWRPVEVLRTNRRGQFTYSYRFRTINSAQRIRFRASALPEAGWPYLPSTSRPRSVIVYPQGMNRR